jgi:hypothetical protein
VGVLAVNKRGADMMRYLITPIVLISLIIGGASAFPINETTKNFRISFDAAEDTNMIVKYWTYGDELSDSRFSGNDSPIQAKDIADAIIVIAGNRSDGNLCGVFVFKNPENTSNIEKSFIENQKAEFVRVFDRIIDGHKALLLKTGDEPSDPLMAYDAIYWLDEVNGKATKLVLVGSDQPDIDKERLLNTIHVEEIGRTN